MPFSKLSTAAAAAVILCGASAGARAQAITGAGSTFAQPIYQKWADASQAETGITLNYQGVGSGAGQKLVLARTVDFGASDAPMASDKLKAAHLLQFPTVVGAEVIAVNLPGISDGQLRLTGALLASIYMGDITNWNDPAIAAVNPTLKLPDLAIAPVYRADGSGTTYVFTSYLSKVSPDFKEKVGADKAVSWPAGTGAKGNAGVAGAVKNQVGGLGYVESAYATMNHLTTTQLQNHDGAFIAPSSKAYAAAAVGTDWAKSPDFAVDLNDQPGESAWPIVSATFVLLPEDAKDPGQTEAVEKFFLWAFKKGDDLAMSLQYVPLPQTTKDEVWTAWQHAKAH